MRNHIRWVAVGALLMGLGAGCSLFQSTSTETSTKVEKPDPKPAITQGVAASAKGTLEVRGSQYVVTGDARFTSGLYVQNSNDAKVDAALAPLVGKTVEVYGRLASANSGDMLVVWVNGQKLYDEADLRTEAQGKTFTEIYVSMTKAEKDCVIMALGQQRVDALLANPSTTVTTSESSEVAACNK